MNSKEKKLLILFFVILLVGIIVQGIPLAVKFYRSGVEAIDDVQFKIQRLEKLQARSDYWQSEYEKILIRQEELKALLYVGQSPELIAGHLQSKLKILTTNSRIKVDSMSLADLKYYKDWLLIYQSMTFKTNSASLMKFLEFIKISRPQLIITELKVQSRGKLLNCTMTVVAFNRSDDKEELVDGL